MLRWLTKWLDADRRPNQAPEPVEPLPVINSPGFRVDFLTGGAAPTHPAGLRFHAKLFLWTPLSVLQCHGRFVAEDAASTAENMPVEFGTWVKEPAAPAGWEPLELEEESDAGLVKPSVILPFLKAFRSIAESSLDPAGQARKFNRMHLLNPAWTPFVAALMRPTDIHPDGAPDLASVWFCPHLEAGLKGVGPGLAATLYQAGFMTPAQVREASDAELLKVPGLEKGMLKGLRQRR